MQVRQVQPHPGIQRSVASEAQCRGTGQPGGGVGGGGWGFWWGWG